MRIVVTGREGQVVTSLSERAAERSGFEIVALGRPDLDLADPSTVSRAIAAAKPDLVVSAAAYTAVDKAEDEPELAGAVNALGAGAVAAAAAEAGAPVIHFSTDYVFDGEGSEPYREGDPKGPRSVYGRTKLEGEELVTRNNPRHVILRSAWVYSPFGRNFVKTILALAQTRDEIGVVCDQWGNPTAAHDIADAVLHVAERLDSDGPFGVFHLAGTGSVNWSGFAAHVLEASARHGGPCAAVRAIATSDYPTKVRRPANSRLATTKLERAFGWRAPSWQASSEAVVRRLLWEKRRECA